MYGLPRAGHEGYVSFGLIAGGPSSSVTDRPNLGGAGDLRHACVRSPSETRGPLWRPRTALAVGHPTPKAGGSHPPGSALDNHQTLR